MASIDGKFPAIILLYFILLIYKAVSISTFIINFVCFRNINIRKDIIHRKRHYLSKIIHFGN